MSHVINNHLAAGNQPLLQSMFAHRKLPFRKEMWAMGWQAEPRGPAVRIPGGPIGAFAIHVRPDTPDRCLHDQNRTGSGMNAPIDRHAATLDRDGWCVFDRALDPATLAGGEHDLASRFASTLMCRGAFYSERSKRFGALAARWPQAEQLVMRPSVLGVVGELG